MEKVGDEVSTDGCRERVDESGSHEGMVEEVLAYHRGAGAVEVDRGNVGGVVGDEEISINRRHDAEQHPSWYAELVGQWQHCHDDGTLGVDEYGHAEEDEGP